MKQPEHTFVSKSQNSRGYILAVTVWMVAILGLAGALVNEWTVRTLNQATKFRDHAEAMRVISQTRQDLIFALATGDRFPAGMAPPGTASTASMNPFEVGEDRDQPDILPYSVRFDGSAYELKDMPQVVMRIYDARGLIPVTDLTDREISFLVSNFGADQSTQQALTNRLRDYIDQDDLIRLNGAEAQQYRQLGRPAPPNGRLWSVDQLRHIPGWDNLESLWQAHFEDPILAACRVTGFNPNTAVPVALRTFAIGLTDANLERTLAYRKDTPFRNIREFSTQTEISRTVDPIRFIALPSDCLTVDMTFSDFELRYRFTLNIRVQNKVMPWEFLSLERLPYSDDIDAETTRRRLVFSPPRNSI